MLKKLIRSAQVYAPWIKTLRYDAQFAAARYLGRSPEPDLLGLKHLRLPAEPLFLDVGANHGLVTAALRQLCPHARIVAIEPLKPTYDALARRYRGDDRVDCRNIGLSSEPGELTFHVPIYRQWVFDGLASLDEGEARGWLGRDRLIGFDPRQLQVQPVSCPVQTLDQLACAPFFVKLDVQGHEMAVLQGARATIAASAPIFLIEEPQPEGEIAFLRSHGYVMYAFDGQRFAVNERGRVNAFFIPEAKRDLIVE